MEEVAQTLDSLAAWSRHRILVILLGLRGTGEWRNSHGQGLHIIVDAGLPGRWEELFSARFNHRGSSVQHNLPGGRSTLTSLPESLSPHRDGKNQAQRGSGTCLCHNAHVRVRNTLCPSPCLGLSPCGISMLFALLSFSPGPRPSCSPYYTTADKKPQVLVTRALCFINEALP